MAKKGIGKTVEVLLLTGYMILLIVHAEEVAEGVRTSALHCVNVIVPSLFAFMTAADMLVKSGAYRKIARFFRPLEKLLALPRGAGAVFLIANAAGYPSGAAAVTALFDSGAADGKNARRLLCTCYNGGAAFFAGAVGLAVFGSAKMGLLVYTAVLAANILSAMLLNRLFPIHFAHEEETIGQTAPRGTLLTDSTAAAGESLFRVCGMIMIFDTFLTLADILTAPLTEQMSPQTLQMLRSFLEVSQLSKLGGGGLPYRLFPVICAAGAFGGVCVLMQIKSIVGGRFSIMPFVFARMFCAAVAAALAVPLFRFFGEKAVRASAQPEFIVNFNNFIPSFCLIMMIFLTILRKRLVFSEQI